MDTQKSVNVAAVQSSWAVIKQDLNTYAPIFYIFDCSSGIPCHVPHYRKYVPAGELLNNAAIITLLVNVLTKLSELIDSLGNPDALNGKLVDLANQHKGRGTTRVTTVRPVGQTQVKIS
uniref:Globin domain-containing protein n=1 Tax=Daphnia galeata TaxID=27404 RepID=A0A8J2WLV6_9CRUS|nr:unnamed protein product [Daphnia galeata]